MNLIQIYYDKTTFKWYYTDFAGIHEGLATPEAAETKARLNNPQCQIIIDKTSLEKFNREKKYG